MLASKNCGWKALTIDGEDTSEAETLVPRKGHWEKTSGQRAGVWVYAVAQC